MSKWKTDVPHFARECKSLDSHGHALQYPLTASKIHGLCNVADWQYGGQFQGTGSGSNFSCSILLANLQLVEELRGEIPRHLKLQMDNCAKDNKNSTVLGFCALLVAEGVVETVEVNNQLPPPTSNDVYETFLRTVCSQQILICPSPRKPVFTAFNQAFNHLQSSWLYFR